MAQQSPEEHDLELYVAIGHPLQLIFGRPRNETSYERAAVFMVHLAKAHAFADGNKHTSLKLAKKEILPD